MTDLNIQQFKGEDQDLNLTIENTNGNTINLTRYDVVDVHLDVATDLNRYGEIKLEKTGVNLDSDGTVTFNIEAVDTENLRPGTYLYEVWVEFKNDDNYTAEVGKFFVKPRVDR